MSVYLHLRRHGWGEQQDAIAKIVYSDTSIEDVTEML